MIVRVSSAYSNNCVCTVGILELIEFLCSVRHCSLANEFDYISSANRKRFDVQRKDLRVRATIGSVVPFRSFFTALLSVLPLFSSRQ